FDGAIDARADLYSLGCVAYWLLSGESLFDAGEQAELLRLHAQCAPVRLSERARQPIPEALDSIVMACVEKAPTARPRDADEVSARLAASVPGEPWAAADAEAWWRGRRAGPSPRHEEPHGLPNDEPAHAAGVREHHEGRARRGGEVGRARGDGAGERHAHLRQRVHQRRRARAPPRLRRLAREAGAARADRPV